MLLYQATFGSFYASSVKKGIFRLGFLNLVALSVYSTFWMSYAAIFIPGFGILAAYANNYQTLVLVWFMFTVMLMYIYVPLPFLSLRVVFFRHCRRSLMDLN